MTTLEERLQNWIVNRCHESNPRPRRVAELNAIFVEIYEDRRFWQYQNAGNYTYYEDALSKMWHYFFCNLCEVKTARKRRLLITLPFWWKWYLKIESDQLFDCVKFESWFFCVAEYHLSRKARSFLETRDYAVGRLLRNLKGHLQNFAIQTTDEIGIFEPPKTNEDGTVTDRIGLVSAPEPNLVKLQFEEFLYLLETDPTDELKANTLRGITESTKETTKKPYALTAQTYLLKLYRDEMTIQQIADELDIPRGALQGGHRQTKWKALARKYAEMAGYGI